MSNRIKCKVCNEHVSDPRNETCSFKCRGILKTQRKIQRWLEGVESPVTGKNIRIKPWVRDYLIEQRKGCEECGVGEVYNGKYLVLEIDHIDGNCTNNSIDNLRVLCPNCHSQTRTYRAKNKNSKRNRK